MCGVSRVELGLNVAKGESIETLIWGSACARFDAVNWKQDGPRDEPYREKEAGHQTKEANKEVGVETIRGLDGAIVGAIYGGRPS